MIKQTSNTLLQSGKSIKIYIYTYIQCISGTSQTDAKQVGQAWQAGQAGRAGQAILLASPPPPAPPLLSITALLALSQPLHTLWAEGRASGRRQLWTTSEAWPKAKMSRIIKMIRAWPKLKHAWPKVKYEWPKCMGGQNSEVAKMHNDFGHAWPK